MTPRRILDALLDPQRRKHVVSRTVEGFAPTAFVTFCMMAALNEGTHLPLSAAVSALVGALSTLGQFLLYEFVLEPLGTARNPLFATGRYWERGPRADEGEVFERP